MKYLIIIILFLIGQNCLGQTASPNTTQGGSNQMVTVNGGWGVTRFLKIPRKDTTQVFTNVSDSNRITIHSDGLMYYHNGTKWVGLAAASNYVTVDMLNDSMAAIREYIADIPQIDTTSLSNRIDQRIKYSDTANLIPTKPYLQNKYESKQDLAYDAVLVNRQITVPVNLDDSFMRSSLGTTDYQAPVFTTASVSFPSSQYMQLTGGNNSINNKIKSNLYTHIGATTRYNLSIKFVPQDKTNTSQGIAIAVDTQASNFSVSAHFRTTDTGSRVSIWATPGTVLSNSSTSLAFNVGDTLLGTLTRYDSISVAIYKNLRTGDSVTCSLKYPSVFGALTQPRVGSLIIYPMGGTQNVLRYTYQENVYQKSDAFFGTSITMTYSASVTRQRYISQLYPNLSNVSLYGCSNIGYLQYGTALFAQVAQNIINNNHTKVFLELGGADPSVPDSFSAYYNTICSMFYNAGVNVYCLTPLPQASADLRQIRDSVMAIAARYNFTVIDMFPYFKSSSSPYLYNPAYFTGSTHPNTQGHKLFASIVYPYITKQDDLKYTYIQENRAPLAPGSGGVLWADSTLNLRYKDAAGTITSLTPAVNTIDGSSGDINLQTLYARLGGNTTGADITIGNNSSNYLGLRTANTERARFLSTGEFILGTTLTGNGVDNVLLKYGTRTRLGVESRTGVTLTSTVRLEANGSTSPYIQIFRQSSGQNTFIHDLTYIGLVGLSLGNGGISTTPNANFFASNIGISTKLFIPGVPANSTSSDIILMRRTTANNGEVTKAAIVGGTNVTVTYGTGAITIAARGDTTIVSNASITLLSTARTYWYSFNGTTATWTVPSVASSANVTYLIKNRGSGTLTVNTTASANELYEIAATNTLSIPAGGAYVLHNDGTYFTIKN